MSQANDILAYMKKHPITAMDALRLFGCFRLAARIKDLKDYGHIITTHIVQKNGKKFAKYVLVKERR